MIDILESVMYVLGYLLVSWFVCMCVLLCFV